MIFKSLINSEFQQVRGRKEAMQEDGLHPAGLQTQAVLAQLQDQRKSPESATETLVV